MKKIFTSSIIASFFAFSVNAQGLKITSQLSTIKNTFTTNDSVTPAQSLIDRQMETVFTAFNQKDYAKLKPLLHHSMVISGIDIPAAMNDMVLTKMLAQLPTPDSYVIMKTSRKGKKTHVYVDFQHQASISRNNEFVFNEQGLIIEMNLLNGKTASVQYIHSTDSSNAELPNKLVLPFTIRKGIISVNATVNGKSGRFIFDSGAPTLILNQSYFTEENSKNLALETLQGVNGVIEGVGKEKINTFQLGELVIKNLNAFTMDLSHFESGKDQLLGLIGFEVFKEYEVTFDYKRKEITLRKTDAAGNLLSEEQDRPAPLAILDIEMSQHIPIIKTTIAGKEYRMGLDSGAGSNLLYAKYQNTIKEVTKRGHSTKLEGADKQARRVHTAKIRKAWIGGVEFTNWDTAFSDDSLDQLNAGYGLGIDGLIGYEFLSQHVISVNFKKQELKIYE